MATPSRVVIDGTEYYGSYYIDEHGAIKFMGFPMTEEEQ